MCEKKYKYNYLAVITDETEEVVKVSTSTKASSPVGSLDDNAWHIDDLLNDFSVSEIKEKSYRNERKKLFCTCGHSFELDRKESHSLRNGNAIICPECKWPKYLRDCIELTSRLFHNVVNVRYRCFVKEDSIKLACFSDYVGVNVKTGRLYFVSRRSDIIYSKKTDKFFIYKSSGKKQGKLVSLSLHKMNSVIARFLKEKADVYTKVSYTAISPRVIRNSKRDVLDPFNKFLNELLNCVNPKDKNRLSEIAVESKLVDLIKDSSHNTKESFIQNYSDNLSLVISCLQYEYFSNIIFNKGKNYFLELLRMSPAVSFIKKRKPTSPKDIIREMAIQSVDYRKKYYKRSFDLKQDNNKGIKETIDFISKKKKKFNKINIPNFLYNNNHPGLEAFVLFYNVVTQTNVDYDEFIRLYNLYGIDMLLNSIVEASNGDRNIVNIEFKDNAILSSDNFSKVLNHFIKVKSKDLIFFNAHQYLDSLYHAETREDYDVNDFFKLKSWNDVEEFHDDIHRTINLEKLEKFNFDIQEFSKKYQCIKSTTINDINFNLIDDVVILEKESKIMQHCVASYAKRLAQGGHLIFSIIDTKTGDRATLEFYNNKTHSSDFWEFNQLKSKFNRKASNKIIDTVMEFCETTLRENNIKFNINNKRRDLQTTSTDNTNIIPPLPVNNNYVLAGGDGDVWGGDELPF